MLQYREVGPPTRMEDLMSAHTVCARVRACVCAGASALNARHLDRALRSEEWVEWVRGNVSNVKHHPALLGYYIWCVHLLPMC
jgi:uncharacterized membrane protein